MSLDWEGRLDPEVRQCWAALVFAATSSLPNGTLPDGIDFDQFRRVFMRCAEAKGLIALVDNGDGSTNVAVANAGHALMPHLAAIGTGQVVGWPAAVRALDGTAAVAIRPPPEGPIMPPVQNQKPVDEDGLRQAAEELRRLQPLLIAGEYAFGGVGNPVLGFVWMPLGQKPPSLNPTQGRIMRNATGDTFVYLPNAELSLVLTMGMMEHRLVTQLPVGQQIMLVPLPAEVPAWTLIEHLGNGNCPDVPAVAKLINRLFGSPKPVMN